MDAVECLFYNNSANPRAVIGRELCSIWFFFWFFVKIIFFLNLDKEKQILTYGGKFLVFVCMTASFIAQISSSENDWKRVAILAPVAPQKMSTGMGKGNTVHERHSEFFKSEFRFVLINLFSLR